MVPLRKPEFFMLFCIIARLFKKRKLKFVFHLENSIVSYYVKREEDSSPSLKYGFSIYLLIIIAS